MGKKKSVVLMVLLTIVIVVLCGLMLIPFPVSETDSWKPPVLRYDLSTDLGGGYYAYYYPEGVIPETEDFESGKTADDYLKVGGLYLSKDEELGIVENGKVTQDFKDAFNAAAKAITARYESKSALGNGYSESRVSIVDNYSIRVELPVAASDQDNADVDKASATLSLFSYTGEMTLEKGTSSSSELVEEMKDGAKITDLIKSITVAQKYKTAYIKVQFTSAGKEMIAGMKDELSTAPTSSSSDTSSLTTLQIKIGDETILQIYKDSIMDHNAEARPYAVDQVNKDYLETMQIVLDSALNGGGFDVTFNLSAVRTFEPVYGKNVLTLLYIALGSAILAMLVLPVLKMGRFGIVSGYASLSYLAIVVICYKYITGGVFEITLGSALIFLAMLVLINVIQYMIYKAVKGEFDLGKTVESSVKGGYKKTLWNTIDVYAVLLLGALALLVGAAGLHTLALQALICVISAAFINLLWARAINFTFLSASKNKYKYFRFVREDDDDE